MSETPCMVSNVCFPEASGFTCSHCGWTFGDEAIVVEWYFRAGVPMSDHKPIGVYHGRCYRPQRAAREVPAPSLPWWTRWLARFA